MNQTLIASVSGVRGIVGSGFTSELVSRYAAAFARLVMGPERRAVVLARDSRTSGPMFAAAAQAGLQSVGADVIDCGIVPTPTAQLAVEHHVASGGIVVSASHNPIEWNALKFVGPDGIFLDAEAAQRLAGLAAESHPARSDLDQVGSVQADTEAVERHLERVLALPMIDVDAIRAGGFTVALDCVRGAGGVIMPELLERLGCRMVGINLETDGLFPRAPEPVPSNLDELGRLVRDGSAQFGMAVDPDVDRLAIVDEAGRAIGEDYTLAFAVRGVLDRGLGPVAVNLSTSLVVEDAARDYGVEFVRVPVGEANVAMALRRIGAVVGGEGNGGVMLPALHLGRDAPLAAALVLDYLARTGRSVHALVSDHPQYVIVKAKVSRGGDLAPVYQALQDRFDDAVADRQDGLRLAWWDRWLHVRPSGTEPIVRMIAEAPDADGAERLIAVTRELLRGAGAPSCAE